jgi:tetratricopeptide (TPR) repeat protein
MKMCSVKILLALSFLCIYLDLSAQNELAILDEQLFATFKQNNYSQSEKIANEILSISTDTSIFYLNANTVLAIIYKDKGYYSSAIDKNLIVIKIAEKKEDLQRLSAAYNNIGVIYQMQRDYKSAINYFSISLKIESEFNNPLEKSIRYYNIGECYKELDSFDLALSYFSNSLIIEKKHKNLEGIQYASIGLVDVYLNIGQLSDAKRILDKMLSGINEKSGEVFILFKKSLGFYYLKMNRPDESLAHLNFIENYIIKNNQPNYLVDVYDLEIKALEQKGDWKILSLKYKAYLELLNKNQSLEVQNKLNDLIYQNDLKKKELEIKLIKEERDFKSDLNIYTSKISIFLLLLLIFVVGFIFYGLKIK